MKSVKGIIYIILFIVFILAIAFGGWWIKKTISYNFFYESSVQETVKKMVKPECLK